MIHAAIDHLVVTAPSLDAGAAYIRRELGVEMQPGGAHPLMGTHNLLLRLDESTYLEVLAVDPAAAPPDYPRWFGLDELGNRDAPALAAWVARVDDIKAASAALPFDLGDIEEMSRGSFRWLITIPPHGRLSENGVAPVLIQWLSEPHPACGLADAGCSLAGLAGVHADATRIARDLGALALDGRWSLASVGPGPMAGLVAQIRTPQGRRRLGALI